MADPLEFLIKSKYHLATSKRLFKSYFDFEEKRFLVATINESAKSVSNLIRFFLFIEKVNSSSYKKSLSIFREKISPRYLDDSISDNLFKILEIQKAQKASPVEFAKGDKIILLINGNYKILTSERLNEFLGSLEKAIKGAGQIRQV